MNFRKDKGIHVEVIIGEKRITAASEELNAFRTLMGQGHDVTTSPLRLVLWAALSSNTPVVVTLWRSGALYAVVLMTIRRWRGLSTGLASAGNLAGQGGVVAAPIDRLHAFEIAAKAILQRFVAHTVVVSSLESCRRVPHTHALTPGISGSWQFREVRIRLSLAGGLPAVMERLSYKLRRNVRYYRKRAEAECGLRLTTDLTALQRRSAVLALHGSGPYPVSAARAEQIDDALQAMPGQFAVGLKDRAGKWVSYIAGWRTTEATFVDWQLNNHNHEAISISTLMRAYLIEHEAAIETKAIVFVGLTNPFWSRACEPQVCAEMVVTRSDVLGAIARKLAIRIRPNGRVAALLTLSDQNIVPGDVMPTFL